ncbi:hypothetical protein H650_20235 [Enterobacter sp. R4-368]|nr:hypothetical protein H650_20235 [Enterobacter sp. R4-368]
MNFFIVNTLMLLMIYLHFIHQAFTTQPVSQRLPGLMVFFCLPPGLYNSGGSIVSELKATRGGFVFNVEKDDPREAPESGDKKPQPVKK